MTWPTQCPSCRRVSRNVARLGMGRRIHPDPTPWKDELLCRKCIYRIWTDEGLSLNNSPSVFGPLPTPFRQFGELALALEGDEREAFMCALRGFPQIAYSPQGGQRP